MVNTNRNRVIAAENTEEVAPPADPEDQSQGCNHPQATVVLLEGLPSPSGPMG